jgi:membrane-associated protease RseP (regulator of RpoE activity)
MMSEETPGSTGGEASTPPPEPPTQPTEAATPDTPATPGEPTPARQREPIHFQVPRWVAVAVAAVLLLGIGFGIGWIAAPGGGHDGAPIGRVFPGFPGGPQGPRGGQGSTTPQVPGTSNGAFLGVSTQAPSNGQQGVPIAAVQTGSPADQAGLKAGDLITAVDGNSVTDPAQLSQDIRSHQPGDQVTITYTRGGTSAQVQVKLGTRAPVQTG